MLKNRNNKLLSELEDYLNTNSEYFIDSLTYNELVDCLKYLALHGNFNKFIEKFSNHPNFEKKILEIVNKSDDFDILSSLASTIYTPKKVLEILQKNKNIIVVQHAQLCIISKKLDEGWNCSELENLINTNKNDSESGIRYIVASHPKTPKSILEKLCYDDVDSVAMAAKNNLNNRLYTIYNTEDMTLEEFQIKCGEIDSSYTGKKK
jgi:hypothetical protein